MFYSIKVINFIKFAYNFEIILISALYIPYILIPSNFIFMIIVVREIINSYFLYSHQLIKYLIFNRIIIWAEARLK